MILCLLPLLVVIWYNKFKQDTKREKRGENDVRERDRTTERGRDVAER